MVLMREIVEKHPTTSFFIYNIYNNYIINNKSGEIKILEIQMTARHWQ
jgi:hypothetical protein